MQVFISTSNPNTFKYNGLTYPKNFMCIKQGDSNIAIHNAYDTRFQLLGSTHFSQIQVDGVVHTSQANLMAALSTLLFTKQFNYITQSNQSTKLISVGEITVDGNYVTVEPAEWLINGINYETTSNTVLTVPFAATGKNRIDIIIGDTLNQIIRIAGDETTGIAVAPVVPLDTVYITQVAVNDNAIDEPEEPVISDLYITKAQEGFKYHSFAGVVDNLILDKYTHNLLTGSITEVRGCNFGDGDNQVYVGKRFLFINNLSNDILFINGSPYGAFKFYTTNSEDLILKPNQTVEFWFTQLGEFRQISAVNLEDIVVQTITSGDTTHSPSADAVYDYVNDNVSQLIREEFTWSTGSQTFTLADSIGQVYSVEVQGQGALSLSQYSIISSNQVQILDTLNSGDYIVIIYSTGITGVGDHYTQSQTDALLLNKEDKSNKVNTISGSSITEYPSEQAVVDYAVPKTRTISINGSTQSLSGNTTFVTPSRLLCYYNQWNIQNANVWRSWTRNTSNMMTADGGNLGLSVTGSTLTLSNFLDMNFIPVGTASTLNKVQINVRESSGTAGGTFELLIAKADLNANGSTGRGSETNYQIIVQEQFTMSSFSASLHKNNFSISPHTFSPSSVLFMAYRQVGAAGGIIQGVQLLFDFI